MDVHFGSLLYMGDRSHWDSKAPWETVRLFEEQTALVSLYAESHDGIDNVIVVLLEGFDGLLS